MCLAPPSNRPSQKQMSRAIHKHLERTGVIQQYENKRKLTLDELAEMTNRQLKIFLYRERLKDIHYPSIQAIREYREANKQMEK